MIPILAAAGLFLYSVWAVRHAYLRRKQNKGRCGDCPYKQAGMCGGQTGNSPK